MNKSSTKRQSAKLLPATIQFIRREPRLQSEIARAAGVHPSYVSRVLDGVRPPSEKLMIAISRAILQHIQKAEIVALEHEMAAIGTQGDDKRPPLVCV